MSGIGKVCWNELNTRDQAAAKKFYGDLMGWEFESMPSGDNEYVMAKQGDEYVAGFFDMTGLEMLNGVPDHWFTYFAVADLDKTVDEVVKKGGSIRRPPFEVGQGMRIAIVTDASGAVLGLNQSTG